MNCHSSEVSRRSWLLGSLGFVALGTGEDPKNPAIEKIRARGKMAGMEGFDESETASYRGIGDARQPFREAALEICESVAADYRKHFADKGFELVKPKEKLVVVILMGPKSYAMFEGGFIDEAVGGHFDLEENRLVMFDFRGPGANPRSVIPEQDNTLVLVHETIHQLTFNTGLLDLKADVPLLVSEGLGTYGETWRPRHKGDIGAVNLRRRKGLDQGRQQGVKWIPIATLIAEDKLFSDPKTQQVAYAECWLFAWKMLRDKTRLPQFRAYLEALRDKPDPKGRLALATNHLGDLAKLDQEIRTGH